MDNLLQKGRKEATDEYQKFNLNDLIASEVKFLEADPKFKHTVEKGLRLTPDIPDFYGEVQTIKLVVFLTSSTFTGYERRSNNFTVNAVAG